MADTVIHTNIIDAEIDYFSIEIIHLQQKSISIYKLVFHNDPNPDPGPDSNSNPDAHPDPDSNPDPNPNPNPNPTRWSG